MQFWIDSKAQRQCPMSSWPNPPELNFIPATCSAHVILTAAPSQRVQRPHQSCSVCSELVITAFPDAVAVSQSSALPHSKKQTSSILFVIPECIIFGTSL